MKLKSLILGSVAAAGLSTAGFAADLGVLTSLDVCDSLGLTGLTISSDTNCLQISGGVSYELNWGDYRGSIGIVTTLDGTKSIDDNNSFAGTPAIAATAGPDGLDNTADDTPAIPAVPANAALDLDWSSKVEAWLKFVGTASSDFGPASAVIKLKGVEHSAVANEAAIGNDSKPFSIDQAYVQVGSDTVIMVGKKGSIGNFASTVYNFTTLFGYDAVDAGTLLDSNDDPSGFGGVVIQVVTTLADGFKAGIALENINDGTPASAGTLLGVLTYSGENLSAHATVFAKGILDGAVNQFGAHIGGAGTFDAFSVAAAFGYTDTAGVADWSGTLSALAALDMFKIAASAEVLGGTGLNTDFGFGGSVGATITDGIEFNLGGKYYINNNGGADGYHVAAQLIAAVTETIKLTGEVGVYGNDTPFSDFYGSAELAWTPEANKDGFTSSIKGEAHQDGAYKVTFKASKTFQ